MNLRNRLFANSAGALALTIACVHPALAGFTLINPGPTTGTVTTITPDHSETTVIGGGPAAVAPVQVAPLPEMSVPAEPVVTMPAAKPSVTTTTTVQPLAEPAPHMMPPVPVSSSAKIVRGFGRDIPLIIAAQQIAPANTQIALGSGVNPQQPVSWQGGADWHSVLNTALSAKGLTAADQGNVVVISRTGAPVADAAMTAQPFAAPAASGRFGSGFSSPREAAPPVIEKVAKTTPATVVTTTTAAPFKDPAMMASDMATAPMPVPATISGGRKAMPVVETKTVVMTAPDQPMPLTTMADAPATVTTVAVSQPSAVPGATDTTVHMSDMPMSGSVETWKAKNGVSLHDVLSEWTKRAGVTLRWDTEYDYPLQTAVTIDGDFEAAVRQLLRGFNSAQPQPVAKLFRGKDAPMVLLVTQRGNDIATVKN